MASPGPADNTNQLQITDLAEVLQLLRRHGYLGANYYTLGLFLGLSPNTISVIEANHRGDTGRCFSECLTKWLEEADDVQKRGGPTIYSLISALRELGKNGVADGIDMEMHPACKILSTNSAQHSITVALPQLVIVLYLAKLIKAMILPTNVQGEDLLIQIKEAVCKDYQKLEAFAVILCKVKATVEIGNSILKEYSEAFCSDDLVVMNGDDGLEIYLPQSMTSQFVTMRLKFGETFSEVEKCIKEKPPAYEDIKNILSYSSKDLECQIAQRESTNSILKLIRDKCSLNDISMLEFFVTELNIQKAEGVIQKYNEAITEFSETKLSHCLHERFSYISALQCERIIIVVDEDVEDQTIKDITKLSKKIFKKLSPHIKLNVIRDDNSFTITCSFPLILSEQLITAALNNIDVLKESKVKRLTIGYCTVYEVNDTSAATTTEIDEYTSSLSTSSGLMKQLMLSLSVQLINSNEEMNAFKGKSDKQMEQLQKKLRQQEKELEDMQQEQAKSEKEIESLREKIKLINENEKKLQASSQEPPLILQDEIYGGITIDHPLIIKIVQTHQFQRLRNIKILGYTYQNIPKANYSRLQHSIGMYYLAGQYVKQLRRRQPELNITESDVLCVQIAALCYNLGHGPFSHIFEMFLEEICTRDKSDKPWKNISEASVKMFDYMLEDNEDLMASFEKHFDNPKEDIAFIKELIQGTGYEQRKDKKFLHKIIFNKMSGLDVSMIDSTVRDVTVLGKSLTFQWKEFLYEVCVLKCDDDELHKCFSQDDLDACNALFRTRHNLFRELYYSRKSRMAALMIRRILVKSNEIPIFKDNFRRVTLFEATKSMSAYSQLNDSILDVINLYVDDPEVQVLLKCLDTMKVIGQIGSVTPTDEWNEDKIKQHIVGSIKSPDITDQLILDPIKTGYENWNALKQYYYTNDRKTGQWTQEWAQPPTPFAAKQLRIFLVSGDRALIKEVQETLEKLITDEQLPGQIYPDKENQHLMPQVPIEEATEQTVEVASALAPV